MPAKPTKKPSKKTAKKPVKKTSKPKRKRPNKWNDQYRTVNKLLEDELKGLITYLSTIHYTAIILVITSIAALIYSTQIIFNNDHQAVVGFLIIIVTSVVVMILSAWTLKPWVLPRFLLPIDLSELDIKKLMTLTTNPDEYLTMLINHIEAITDQFLIPKLRRLRNAIVILTFGISLAILLSIALP